VQTMNAEVDSMTIARAISSACNRQRNALCAKRTGPVINSWVRERSMCARGQATLLDDGGSPRLLRLVRLVKFPRTGTMKKRLEHRWCGR
jgi:hypothetical protein